VALGSVGYRVRGIDLSPQMVAEAKEKALTYALSEDAVHFQVGELERIPFADNTFDGILCRSVLDFAPSPGAALLELRRVLKPGHRMLLSTLGARSPVKRDHWRRFLPGSTLPAIANHILPWEVEALLPELGWHIIEQSPRFGPSAAGVTNPYDEETGRALTDRVLQQAVATSWEIVAEKPQ
jgi:27-O-demethylrifamycin SV methyltransferase